MYLFSAGVYTFNTDENEAVRNTSIKVIHRIICTSFKTER